MAVRCERSLQQHINVPDAAALRLTSWTIGVEGFRPRSTPDTDEIFCVISKGHSDSTTKGCYYLDYQNNSGTLRIRLGFIDTGSSVRGVAYNITLTEGRWYSIIGSFDNTSKDLKIFLAILADSQGLNGETEYTEVASTTLGAVTPFASTEDLRIGAGVTSAGVVTHVADADIKGPFVYTAEIAKATLDAAFGTHLSGAEASLEAYYRLDEGLGGVGESAAYDRSGNGHDGTLQNSALWAGDPIDFKYSTGLFTSGVLLHHNAATQVGATITASEAASGYAASELLCPKQSRTWRSDDVSGAKTLTVDCGKPMPVCAVAFFGHNFDSQVAATIAGHTADSWGSPDLTAETMTFHPDNMIHFFARPWSYRYWQGSVTNPTNADSYVEVGVFALFVGWQGHFRPLGDMKTLHDPSIFVETPHRQRISRSMTKSIPKAFQFDLLTRQQAQEFQRIVESIGGSGYVFVCAEPDRHLYDFGVYGRLAALPDFSLHGPAWTHSATGTLAIEADFA